MGYSSPKKQLDLKDFLNKPSTGGMKRNRWVRTAPQKPVAPEKIDAKAAAEAGGASPV